MFPASPFLMTGVISAYLRISAKFPLFTELLKIMRVCMNRVNHDFNWNVFKNTGFIFRTRSVSSLQNYFLKHYTKIESWFLKRDYPVNMIDEEIKKVKKVVKI